MSIGNVLLQTRERKGIKLEDVADATKIPLRFLVALEKEQFHMLPERLFVRFYIGAYSKYLGLNSSELLQEFDQIYPPEKDD